MEQDEVAKILEGMFKEGCKTSAIVTALNARGLKTRGGKPWSYQSVKQRLKTIKRQTKSAKPAKQTDTELLADVVQSNLTKSSKLKLVSMLLH